VERLDPTFGAKVDVRGERQPAQSLSHKSQGGGDVALDIVELFALCPVASALPELVPIFDQPGDRPASAL
jgi:hypothetical protein